jgi:hypothetical protein
MSNVRALYGYRASRSCIACKRFLGLRCAQSTVLIPLQRRGVRVDLVVTLLVALVRDVLCQGTGALLVAGFSGGKLVADRCGTVVVESEVQRVNSALYVRQGQRHIEWWAVFGVGVAFWLSVAIFLAAAYALREP